MLSVVVLAHEIYNENFLARLVYNIYNGKVWWIQPWSSFVPCPGSSYLRGRLSTVDLLVLTSLDQFRSAAFDNTNVIYLFTNELPS